MRLLLRRPAMRGWLFLFCAEWPRFGILSLPVAITQSFTPQVREWIPPNGKPILVSSYPSLVGRLLSRRAGTTCLIYSLPRDRGLLSCTR
jgi:hypothetical protein